LAEGVELFADVGAGVEVGASLALDALAVVEDPAIRVVGYSWGWQGDAAAIDGGVTRVTDQAIMQVD
jgi:hypothetical protein